MSGKPIPPGGWSPLYETLFVQWTDWCRGIPPSRKWKGRSAQNPRLLRAFATLDRAQRRAEAAVSRTRR